MDKSRGIGTGTRKRQKAFDTLNHKILLSNVECYDMPDVIVDLHLRT